jgi:hypothetical protein
MRLPGGNQNIGVQSLGREQLDDGSGRAKAGLAAVVVEEVDQYQERKTRHQLSLSDAALVTKDSDFSKKYDGQEQIRVSDLPKVMQKEYASENTVPAFEVRAALYEREMGEFLNEQAERIGNEHARAEWLIRQKGNLDSHVASRYVKRDQEQIAYNNKEAISAAEEAVDGGMYAVGISLIRNSDLDKVTQDEMVNGIEKQQESDVISDMVSVGDLEGLKQELQILNSKDYDGAFTSDERVTQKKKVRAEIKYLVDEDKAIVIGNKSDAHVQKLMADPDMTAGEQNAFIDGIKDDEVKVETRKRMKSARIERKRIEDKDKRDKSENYLEDFWKNPTAEKLAAAPDMASRIAAGNFLNQHASGKPPETDVLVYQDVRAKILARDSSVILAHYKDKLSESRFTELVRLQQTAPDDPTFTSAQSLGADINDVISSTGIPVKTSGKKSEKQIRMTDYLQRGIEAEELATGKKLAPTARKDLLRSMSVEYTTKFENDWFSHDYDFNDIVENIPEPRLRYIESRLRANGISVNPEEIHEYNKANPE